MRLEMPGAFLNFFACVRVRVVRVCVLACLKASLVSHIKVFSLAVLMTHFISIGHS